MPSDMPPIDALVERYLTGVDELVLIDDPLEAELWISSVLGATYKLPLPIGVQDDMPRALWDGVVAGAKRRATPGDLALLRGVAALADDPLAGKARAAAERLAKRGVGETPWTRELGTARFVSAAAYTDAFGDQTSFVARFRYSDRPEHALIALYDENLGGIIKDAFVGAVERDPFPEPGTGMTTAPIEGSELARRVLTAIRDGDMYIDNDWTDDFKHHRALLLARMRPLGSAVVEDFEPLGDDEREALIERFLAAGAPADDDVTRAVLDHCLVARCDYGDGDPLRWSPTMVEMFLLDFLPRKAAMGMQEIRALPYVLQRWVRFALTERGVDEPLILETEATVAELAGEFRAATTDPASAGPSKAIAQAMMADGVDQRGSHS